MNRAVISFKDMIVIMYPKTTNIFGQKSYLKHISNTAVYLHHEILFAYLILMNFQ